MLSTCYVTCRVFYLHLSLMLLYIHLSSNFNQIYIKANVILIIYNRLMFVDHEKYYKNTRIIFLEFYNVTLNMHIYIVVIKFPCRKHRHQPVW